jgi:precorrin-8X/cobalt-precorrin-8 methylmutase
VTLFDRYIAVDWSANNKPKGGKDSIWIAEQVNDRRLPSVNPRTRRAAMENLVTRLESAVATGERTFVGFDFPFGYPRGTAFRLSGNHHWSPLWATIGDEIQDREDNRSNRFEVAAMFNALLGPAGPRFWGCPVSAVSADLSTHKHGARFDEIAEFRVVERVAKGAKSTWQLFYNGSVGSQCLLGLAQLQKLRRGPRLANNIAIWPFQTDFERNLNAPIVFAEIYPSLDEHDRSVMPRDRAQVEAQVQRFAELDRTGRFSVSLSLPAEFAEHRYSILAEEGWIVGAGHGELVP